MGRPPIHETEAEQRVRVAKGDTTAKPMLNQRFGKLVVTEFVRTNNRQLAVWKCQCDCGGTAEFTGYHLRQGRYKSCGCQNSRLRGKENPGWSGYEEISGSYWHRIRQGAKARGFELSISIQDAWKIFEDQKGLCALTGLPIKLCPSDYDKRDKLLEQTASLDRIDSKKGYTKENVQWVHKRINTLKMDANEDEFIEWCCRVAAGPKVVKSTD